MQEVVGSIGTYHLFPLDILSVFFLFLSCVYLPHAHTHAHAHNSHTHVSTHTHAPAPHHHLPHAWYTCAHAECTTTYLHIYNYAQDNTHKYTTTTTQCKLQCNVYINILGTIIFANILNRPRLQKFRLTIIFFAFIIVYDVIRGWRTVRATHVSTKDLGLLSTLWNTIEPAG